MRGAAWAGPISAKTASFEPTLIVSECQPSCVRSWLRYSAERRGPAPGNNRRNSDGCEEIPETTLDFQIDRAGHFLPSGNDALASFVPINDLLPLLIGSLDI